MDYQKYLRSEKWKQFRQRALKYYGYRCFVCGTNRNLQVHHLPEGYRHVGNEQVYHVRILCRQCHTKGQISLVELNRRKNTKRWQMIIEVLLWKAPKKLIFLLLRIR